MYAKAGVDLSVFTESQDKRKETDRRPEIFIKVV